MSAITQSTYQPYYEMIKSERTRKAYKAICQAICEHRTQVRLPEPIRKEAFDGMHPLIKWDNPLFYGSEVDSYYSSGGLVTEVIIKYKSSRANLENDVSLMEAKIAPLLRKCRGRSDCEKAALIHDWLCLHNVYELKAPHCFDLRGAVLDGEAVCAGFAHAFKWIGDCVGLKVVSVFGDGGNPTGRTKKKLITGNHAFSQVQIGGEWFWVDVSNDVCWTAGSGVPSRRYFLLDDKSFATNHEFNKRFKRCPRRWAD